MNKIIWPMMVAILVALGSFGCTKKTESQSQPKATPIKSKPSQSGVINPSVLNRLKRHESRQGVNKPVLLKAVVNGLLKQEKGGLDCKARCTGDSASMAACRKVCAETAGQLRSMPAAPKPNGGAADSKIP